MALECEGQATPHCGDAQSKPPRRFMFIEQIRLSVHVAMMESES
jgi:hypothetical protein